MIVTNQPMYQRKIKSVSTTDEESTNKMHFDEKTMEDFDKNIRFKENRIMDLITTREKAFTDSNENEEKIKHFINEKKRIEEELSHFDAEDTLSNQHFELNTKREDLNKIIDSIAQLRKEKGRISLGMINESVERKNLEQELKLDHSKMRRLQRRKSKAREKAFISDNKNYNDEAENLINDELEYLLNNFRIRREIYYLQNDQRNILQNLRAAKHEKNNLLKILNKTESENYRNYQREDASKANSFHHNFSRGNIAFTIPVIDDTIEFLKRSLVDLKQNITMKEMDLYNNDTKYSHDRIEEFLKKISPQDFKTTFMKLLMKLVRLAFAYYRLMNDKENLEQDLQREKRITEQQKKQIRDNKVENEKNIFKMAMKFEAERNRRKIHSKQGHHWSTITTDSSDDSCKDYTIKAQE